MNDSLPAPIRAYWKKHASATVHEAFAKHARLADCVVILSPKDGAPRLVKRSEASQRLANEGYPSFLFELDLGQIDEPDELALVWKDAGGAQATKLRVGRGDEPPTPIRMPPFTPSFKQEDPAWQRGVAVTIAGFQQVIEDGIRASGDDLGAYMVFWSLFTASPFLLVRESAKAALGTHRRWKEIVGHVYTPCEDVLVLVDMNDRLVPFVRPSKAES